ncbi:MAG TPA: thioredoxin family protein [Usitatibacter sp.]|nr:thioredoxin family protein [Usitatibacter sp.]
MRFLIAALLLFAGLSQAADKPYDESADAKADIRHALAQAQAARKPVLVVFGANWCPDCRALDIAMKGGRNAELIAKEFEVVKVDVGRFDRNVDVAASYDVPLKKGIPAVAVVSPGGRLISATRGGELADARRMSEDGLYRFFRKAADEAKAR